MNSKFARRFWKTVVPFMPHRSMLGRIIRARGCKLGPPDDYLASEARRLNKKFTTFPPDTEILCLGSSHIDYGINPACFTKFCVAEAGVRNGDLYQAVNIYRELSHKWPRAKGQIVLLGLDFWMSSLQSEFTESYFITTILHCVADVPYRSSILIKNSEKIVRRALQTPLSVASKTTNVSQCWQPVETPKTVCRRAQDHLKAGKHKPTEVCYLKQLRNLVESDGRCLVIMRPPVRSDYWAECMRCTTAESLWDPLDSAIQGLVLLDYTSNQVPDTLFGDCDHLSSAGCQYLAKMLERDLISLSEP